MTLTGTAMRTAVGLATGIYALVGPLKLPMCAGKLVVISYCRSGRCVMMVGAVAATMIAVK